MLIIGCGDVGLRVARQLPARLKVIALTSSPDRLPALRREGITPLLGNLDAPATLRREDDVYTSHIHANDLARACLAALWRGRPQRISNVCDDTALLMGDYFDLAADLYHLPRPPRVARGAANEQLPLMLLSFMGESRRLDNRRMKNELRLALRYPTVSDGLCGLRG